MVFARPTLTDLLRRIRQDFLDQGLEKVLQRGSTEDFLARMVRGLAHGLHGHAAWVARQILPANAEDDVLLRWARILHVPLLPAAKASGVAIFATSGDILIPVGSLVRRDDGTEYLVTSSELVGGGGLDQTSCSLEAVETGTGGNADAGDAVTLAVPIAGVTSATVLEAGGASGGRDVESVESLRTRVEARLQYPDVQGGPGNWGLWALEVPGVAYAWERAQEDGAGTLDLYFVDQGEDGWVIPAGGRLTTVENYLLERSPEGMTFQVTAPVADPIDFTIALTPDTAEVRSAVEASLQRMFETHGEPGERIPLTVVAEAISNAAGETDHTLTSPSSAFVPSVSAGNEYLPMLGTITWT